MPWVRDNAELILVAMLHYESHPKCNRVVFRRPARPVAGKLPDLSNLAGG
jgi:hypothetical protein